MTNWVVANGRVTTSNTPGTILTPVNDPTTRGLVVAYTLDNNGNVTQVSESDGGVSNPDVRRTTIMYDAVDRPIRVVTPNPGASAASVAGEVRNNDAGAGEVGGYVSTVLYDNVGNTYRSVDALGHTYDVRYDLLNRPGEEMGTGTNPPVEWAR